MDKCIAPETEEQATWDLEIKPRASLFDLNLKSVWQYRDLMWIFVRRDFVAKYKQTILGPLWHFIQPIFTTIMFLLVFGKIAGIPTDGIEPVLFYMSGITIWNYFASCITATSNTFVTNAAIFGKVYFPRLIMPLSIVISNLIQLAIQFSLLTAVAVWFHFNGSPIQLGWNISLLPITILLIAGHGLGWGIIISSLTTKYRDLTILVSFGVQLLLYITPVAYPLSFVEDKGYRWIIEVNPLSAITETFRYALFGQGQLNTAGLLYSSCFMIAALISGIAIFNKVEKSFMDTV